MNSLAYATPHKKAVYLGDQLAGESVFETQLILETGDVALLSGSAKQAAPAHLQNLSLMTFVITRHLR